VVNVYVKISPGSSISEPKRPVSEVTVWATVPWFRQHTVVPGEMLTFCGVKANSVISTTLAPAGQVGPEGGGPQLGNLKLPMRVRHGFGPVVCRYSCVYQNVQSSVGSMPIIE
jgi:hypothetical protein